MPRNIVKKIIKACIPYGLLWLYRRINPIETINRLLRKQLNKKHIEFSGCHIKWFGTTYGGFDVCTEMLEAKREQEIIVYSAGVGCDISFDMELIGRYDNIKILAFDPWFTKREGKNVSARKPRSKFYDIRGGVQQISKWWKSS